MSEQAIAADIGGDQEEINKDEIIATLAQLSPIEYSRVRKEWADRLSCTVGALDAELKQWRKAASVATPADVKRDLKIVEREPWGEAIKDGARLLDAIYNTLKRFIVMREPEHVAVVLWVVFTYLIENPGIAVSPRLAILSPEGECGKTSLIQIIGGLAFRSKMSSGISPAAIFRMLDALPLTLLIDEADTVINNKDSGEQLRGVLNSGHGRRGRPWTARFRRATRGP